MFKYRNKLKSTLEQVVQCEEQKDLPLVSVVMPALNQADFIEQAIRSVLKNETLAFPIELIVMDGGSTDGTQRTLTNLSQEMNGRLRWWSESDQGPAHALNKAVRLARGEIIGWLNADDLYAPGAVQRAINALKNNQDWLMVYGHGQHVNSCGSPIGDYPTLRPGTSFQSFSEGCFICQPTVFLRKNVFDYLGGLDERLKAAFDFDLWMRLFKQYPNQIGFIDDVQAYSRLHSGCITVEQRETVTYEGMQVVARYLDTCPIHWFKTYLDEVMSNYPHGRQINDVKKHLKQFSRKVEKYLSYSAQVEMMELLKTDARIQLASADAGLDIYPDGWLPPLTRLRVRQCKHRWRIVELHGEHVNQNSSALCMNIYFPDGTKNEYRIEEKGRFGIKIKMVTAQIVPAYSEIVIESTGGFVPRDIEVGNDDRRELICKIDSVRLIA